MSLYDALIAISDVIEKSINELLNLPLWLWGLAFAAVLAFEYFENQFYSHKRKEFDRINLLKKEKKQ